MPVSVYNVISRAKVILQDAGNVRWPTSELSDWAVDGAKEIALMQPSATAITENTTLAVGTRQIVPVAHQSLIRVTRNMALTVGKRAVTPTSRQMLDAQFPDWHDTTKVPFSLLVRHVVIDAMDPQTFFVFPGNTGTGVIECVYSTIPALSAQPADPLELEDYKAITLPMIPIWQSALTDYVLYRAFSKDQQYAGSAQMAAAAYGQFQNALTARQNSIATANPNTTATQPRP